MKNFLPRRRNYFIKKKYQANFSMKFCLLLIAEAILITGLFLMISRGTLTTGYSGTELKIEKTSQFFFLTFVLQFLIVGVAIGIVGMVVFIFHSHRIAGPLYS